MKLYSYFRSSAAYRVRIALNLKGLAYDTVPIHLLNGGGEQFSPEYRKLNPEALVPALIDESLPADGNVLTQSLAIIEYLEETHPQPPLLPADAAGRAHVRSLALAIACDIHPLNNLRVLRYLVRNLKVSEDDKNAWYRHWVEQGLGALETRLAADRRTGKFCFGDTPGLADCCLVPQIFNAQRLNCDLSGMPTLLRINDACSALDAFAAAAPGVQPDAQ
ncbi:MAG: maleylacetoacetate isomerase [Noviherbaspirillum sp.]